MANSSTGILSKKAVGVTLIFGFSIYLAFWCGTQRTHLLDLMPQNVEPMHEQPTALSSPCEVIATAGSVFSHPTSKQILPPTTSTTSTTVYVAEISKLVSEIKVGQKSLASQSQQPLKGFCGKYPGQYRCPSYVMIGIRLRNKPGYIKFTASVLWKYNNVAIEDVHLFADASDTVNIEKLKEWYGAGVKYFPSDKQIGDIATTRSIFENFSANSKYEVLLLLDCDMILLENWFTFLEDHISLTDGILSLYHPSVCHSLTADCDMQVGNLCVGDPAATSGVALTKSMVKAILAKSPDFNPDLGWKNALGNETVTISYPPKSLVMRIGQEKQDSDNCGENEPPYRFNRCEYPVWILNQIEFYFDRCTSPNEIYPDNPNTEEFQEKMRTRFWARPAISYSLYGSGARYVAIALGNAARVSSVYPGWKMWVYHDDSVPDPYLQKFCENNVRLIDMSGVNNINKMSWRFLVGSEPVKMYAVRDIDSYLLPRGKAAVDEWIASGRKFHVLRDHPNHSAHPMNGGMWGGTHDAMPNIKEELEKFTASNAYMVDMNFLRQIVWPIAQKSAWVNDAHSKHKYGEDHPFPTKQKSGQEFVGNVMIWP